MGELIYLTTTSVDGYINDADGSIDFTDPSEEVHRAVNDLLRPVAVYLFGRRLYETMRVWETLDTEGQSGAMEEFAGLWNSSDKVIFSSTLDEVVTSRTRLERTFDAEAVRAMKAAVDGQLAIGGAELAGHAIRAELVDQFHFVVAPTVIGGGTRTLPEDVRLDLTLVDERRFANGTVLLSYRPRA